MITRAHVFRLSISYKNRTMILAGIFAPAFFAILMILLGVLTPGYDHMGQRVSELGVAGSPYALVINYMGFALFGVFIMMFSVVLYYYTGKTKFSLLGATLTFIVGLGVIGLGVFPCDPGCANASATGQVHMVLYALAITFIVMGLFIFSYTFNKNSNFKGYSIFTLAIGISSAIVWILAFFVIFGEYAGLVQRIGIAISLVWVEAIAIRSIMIKSH